MSFTIDFNSSEIISVDKKYKGQLENGHKFEILSNWNPWDGWSIEDIWFESDFSEMEDAKNSISDKFLSTMNE